MADRTKIEWTDATWSPVRGCSVVSDGCQNCYAMRQAHRFSGPGKPYEGLTRMTSHGPKWTGDVRLVPEKLDEPLRWRKPRRVFVNSMSDLFHEDVPDEYIDQVFAVMALSPQHTFQVLTKRPERMRDYVSDPSTPFRVQRAMDAAIVDEAMRGATEERRDVAGYPDYEVSNFGKVYSRRGSSTCVMCGSDVQGTARKIYCSKRCRQKAAYVGRHTHAGVPVEMSPDVGEDGHLRVMLYRGDGAPVRELVHRLVLSAFEREPVGKEEGCHRNSVASDNRIANLRWGSHAENLADRKRHGRARSWSKLTDEQVEGIRRRIASGHPAERIGRDFGVSGTQIRNIALGDQWATTSEIQWPLPNLWAGVSVENQAAADERIPLLLQTPAAVRFVSAEPLLGPISFAQMYYESGNDLPEAMRVNDERCSLNALTGLTTWPTCHYQSPSIKRRTHFQDGEVYESDGEFRHLDWVITGGESGPGARPCSIEWIRSILEQCKAAGVPAFCKQLGAAAMLGPEDGRHYIIRHRKGAEMDEWPEDLRVRQMPGELGA